MVMEEFVHLFILSIYIEFIELLVWSLIGELLYY